MDGNNDLYRYNTGAPPARGVAPDDARRLLSTYPMASATPTTHPARHLTGLTTPAAPPSFAHPAYYSNAAYTPNSPSYYTEYDRELAYLREPNEVGNDSGFWESTRDTAVRAINHQAGPAYQYPTDQQWAPSSLLPQSSFPTNVFAQSIFQRTMPASAYPTPPPIAPVQIATSSLAFALGGGPSPPKPKPKPVIMKQEHTPEQSAAFVNGFIAQKTENMRMRDTQPHPRPKTPPTVHKHEMSSPEGPNAFSLRPTAPSLPSGMMTPRKRKIVDADIPHSPLKRFQSNESLRVKPTISTPQTDRRHFGTMPTPRRTPYIAVPPNPWMTPSKRKRMSSEDSPCIASRDERGSVSPSKTATRGNRDERGPLDKLSSLFTEILEAEDAIPADADISDLDVNLFSSSTIEVSRPLLSPKIIQKLAKSIDHVSHPGKRVRNATSPVRKARVGDIEAASLSRILKILERSVRLGEDVDPFSCSTSLARKSVSPKKPRTRKRSKSKTPLGGEDGPQDDGEDVTIGNDASSLDIAKSFSGLERAREAMSAAECCISVLGADRLPKQLYSEELITSCLNVVKNTLNQVIYPFVEATPEANNPLLRHVLKSDEFHKLLQEIFQTLSSTLPRLNALINSESVSMSDSIIISAVYISIGPFFVVEAGGEEGKSKKAAAESAVIRTFGKSAMRGLRLDALTLIRSIFATHEEQRGWIIEEILVSLIKLSDSKQKAGQFRLRDGKSIRTVSALLLQLVQTSAHDVRVGAKKIEKARVQKFALRRQESLNEGQIVAPDPFMDEQDEEEVRIYASGLESAKKTAQSIILFLTRRSGTGKATKTTNEAEYRTIFDNLITDVLAVLYWPEWPAASLLLSVVSKFLVSALDDVKDSKEADNNAVKTIALEHLGVIAARIRTNQLKGQNAERKNKLKSLDEIINSVGTEDLARLVAHHTEILAHLSKRAVEDQANNSAQELTAAMFGQELAQGLRQIKLALDADEDGHTVGALEAFGKHLKKALRSLSSEPNTDIFDAGSQEEIAKIDRYAVEAGTIQSLRHSFYPILNVVLSSLEASAIFMRTKGLKALGQILMSDPTILSQSSVRKAIDSHLLDNSPAVRDAAIELIGKYMVESPEVAEIYYKPIADRIIDTGLSVRKRVIKLLKEFYAVTQDTKRQADICCRLVVRIFDEDESVRDLATKTLELLWFPPPALTSALKKQPTTPHDDHNQLLAKVTVIMSVSGNFKDRQSALEDVIHSIISQKDEDEVAYLHQRYSDICEILIDGLVDASDLPDFTVVNCIKTIHLFASAYPAVLTSANASTLLPYLKNPMNLEEQVQTEYLLKIFRCTIPHMPKTSTKFGQDLQQALQPLIIKPSVGGVHVLQETVACYCTSVQMLTKDYSKVAYLLKSCNERLQKFINLPPQSFADKEAGPLIVLVLIVSLLGEHFPFDTMRLQNATVGSEVDAITKGSIVEYIYDSLLKLYGKYRQPTLKGRFLQCLGFIFRAQPTLMTYTDSAAIMDEIFASDDFETRGRLLRIFQDFLASEAAKHAAKEKANSANAKKPVEAQINMDELIGNTDGFADSGVGSAVIQRYLEHILQAALSRQQQVQTTAIDILSFTIRQGLAHPLQSFPVVVALETSSTTKTSNRANALHALLQSKHSTLINTRYLQSAKAAFDYQTTLAEGAPVRGLRLTGIAPVALLQPWYSLIREKRTARQDFLKAVLKVFGESSHGKKTTQENVDFARFMADNLSAFDYKTQEEVFIVIKTLNSYLGNTGSEVLQEVSPSHLLSQFTKPDAMDVDQAQPPQVPLADRIGTMRGTIVVAMAMLLKAHLKELYTLTEDKCNKFVLGKKSAIGDKAAARRHQGAIVWDRIPFAMRPLLTTTDVDEQRARFIDIWNEDGQTAEPDDVFDVV
ncbi:hypothetical protein CYLTODRAFT_436196 [Cylindrobasidium torrendii FP15055 ss-10]|uniref:Sister chromatid cohesion protein n=1 Tax=Cylindrobasidium torrendii FP15055 ss-10 TaxID=1314674 RepID=A0A0D7BFQ4_9AGAR|nr:hypothetical protein CYLTODRAFT_436196 [Cylindrobasidium torrendii FP15055 ss-10]